MVWDSLSLGEMCVKDSSCPVGLMGISGNRTTPLRVLTRWYNLRVLCPLNRSEKSECEDLLGEELRGIRVRYVSGSRVFCWR